jgi:hypothetical protein
VFRRRSGPSEGSDLIISVKLAIIDDNDIVVVLMATRPVHYKDLYSVNLGKQDDRTWQCKVCSIEQTSTCHINRNTQNLLSGGLVDG